MAHRRRKKSHAEGHQNNERWLISYADFITLLMVFFVVMYSMSSSDSEKFKKISQSLSQAFNVDVLQGSVTSGVMDGTQTPDKAIDDLIAEGEAPQMQRLLNKIEALLDGTPQAPEVSVGRDKDGVVVRLSGSYLFDSGRAELKPNSLGVLDAIADELRAVPNDIRIDGHTDATPIDSPRYASNWELSAARALAVTRYLTETNMIRAGRVMAAGLGEFHPIASNDTREGRAQNRRVEIHILSSGPSTTANSPPAREQH
ncbi:MAG: OmpA family protein [Chloroflexota bacterium]|nr:OmpA family protein [Chloroflexota bacterium]